MSLHRLHLSSKAMYSTGSATPCKNIVEAPGIPKPSPILQTGNQVATCQLGLEALLHDAQCSTSLVGHSLNKWLLHEASMKGIHQTAKRSPTPKGRTSSLQSTEVKHPLSKLSQLCISIMDHLSCYNPSWTIQGLNIHHVPQIS
jgi:hypothetical protein